VRHTRTINAGWRFLKGDADGGAPPYDDASWERVNVPHTWNALDVLDNTPDYFRGVCWYQKRLRIPADDSGRRVFLRFEAANQDAVVYVNGQEVGAHLGGYTAFTLDVTGAVAVGAENVVTVRLDNRLNPDVPPIGGDLCCFGGIYRNVWLVRTAAVHFDMLDHGSSGVYVDTPDVSAESATVRVRGAVVNDGAEDVEVVVVSSVYGPDGGLVTVAESALALPAGERTVFEARSAKIAEPSLWSPESPAVYSVHCVVHDAATRVGLDEVRSPLGFRWVSVDADDGFFLNGEHLFIKGIGKHQDYDRMGYAVPDDVLREDVRLVQRMGANLLRAHYPQAPVIYEEMDALGVMGWAKLPIMDKVAHTPAFHRNALRMMRELVLQNFNHPSIVMWGHACEILGDMDWFWPRPIDPERKEEHLRETREFCVELEELTRRLDPARLTANDYHTDPNPQWYWESGLTDISMLNAWNIYMGWYHVDLDEVGAMMDTTRACNPGIGYMIAETGAGSDSRIHTHEPTIFDFSTEYQDLYTQTYLDQVARRPWCAGLCFWTLVDFQVKHRRDTMPHINNKGMLRSDRTPKDAYYLLQAHWSDEPMLHIASRDWTRRVGFAEGNAAITMHVNVYSNQRNVELMHNGASLGVSESRGAICTWNVDFVDGANRLEAIVCERPELRDFVTVHYQFFPRDLAGEAFPDADLCINVGQSRTFFTDPLTGNTWAPDRRYEPGAFGHVDGRYYRHWTYMQAWEGIREGVDAVMLGTGIGPVFQTFLLGLSAYRLDVPDGEYELELCFVEPFNLERRTDPSELTSAGPDGARVFDVAINGDTVLSALDLAGDYGEHTAVTERFPVRASGGDGIEVGFRGVHGEPVLSGVKIRRAK
jgi:beta-galactosidase